MVCDPKAGEKKKEREMVQIAVKQVLAQQVLGHLDCVDRTASCGCKNCQIMEKMNRVMACVLASTILAMDGDPTSLEVIHKAVTDAADKTIPACWEALKKKD